MNKKTFDFVEGQQFELKTSKGSTVLREPTPPEYFKYLEGLKVENRELADTYEFYIEYFVKLGGKEDALRTLTLQQVFEVAMAVNGVDGEPKGK